MSVVQHGGVGERFGPQRFYLRVSGRFCGQARPGPARAASGGEAETNYPG